MRILTEAEDAEWLSKCMETALNETEAKKLLLVLAASRGERGFTDEEGAVVVNWASYRLVMSRVVELALMGYLNLDVHDGEVYWQAAEKRLNLNIRVPRGKPRTK